MDELPAVSCYGMLLRMTDQRDVWVTSLEVDAVHLFTAQIAEGRLYSRVKVKQPVDVRMILIDQYVNIATWLHRNGAWEQMALE